MRIAGYITHPDYKITIFHYQSRYSLKIENPYFEQTFKLNEDGFQDIDKVKSLVDASFLEGVSQRFESMAKDLNNFLIRNTLDCEENWPEII
jgi:hypothetical protein